jgi:hypothetical protein
VRALGKVTTAWAAASSSGITRYSFPISSEAGYLSFLRHKANCVWSVVFFIGVHQEMEV